MNAQNPKPLEDKIAQLEADKEHLEKQISIHKNKDGLFKTTLLNITAPKTWKGVAVGIAISILTYKIATMDAAMFVVKALLAIGAILAIGFFGGQWAAKKTQQKALETLNNTFSTSKETTANLIATLYQIATGKKISEERTKELSNTVNEYKPLLINGGNWILAVILRIMAFSSLMGVLAIAVSFAIAIATFMQVELLEQQNTKLDKQNKLLETQDSLLVEQNKLFDQQNIKVGKQTDLMERQTGQIDTQNLYIVKQIQQASIQNRLVTAQNIRLDQQTYLQEAERRGGLVFLFSNIMDAIDKELKEDYNNDSIRNLSPQLIGRIITLSRRLEPYRYLDGDTLITKALSPERGQLLINLLESQLDDFTYICIFKEAEFRNADLWGVNLKGKCLSEINLQYANFCDNNSLWWKANLENVDFSFSNLSNANLTWANLSRSNFAYAQLRETNFSHANLQGVDFGKTGLFNIKLEKADLRGTIFKNTHVNTLNFIDNLKKQQVIGYERIKKMYYVDTIPHYNPPFFDGKRGQPYYVIKEREPK